MYYYTACNDGDIRLLGGHNGREGTVELCYEGAWGSVCDDGWYSAEASVACRNLGFPAQGDWLLLILLRMYFCL